MKVDEISDNIWNAIGMTINTDKTNNSQTSDKLWYNSYDYLAWSASGRKTSGPNGFLCGTSEHEKKNIFVLNKFKYVSNNNNYKECAAPITTKDVVILVYDSDLNILSLSKENNSSFDAKLINLPKNQTMYWFVGHFVKKMCLTIV